MTPHAFARLSFGVPPCAVAAALLGAAATLGCKDATGPTTGAAHVMVATAGLDLDADGYLVTVDREQRPIGSVDAITLSELPTGFHHVGLSGVAANCAVNGDALRTVTVTAGDTTEIAFAVGCAPMFGTVQVAAATSGLDMDPDGFTVALDAAAELPVAVNGTALISPVPPGEHTLELRGVAANCAVEGAATRVVILAGGAPGDTARPRAEVSFAVACAALIGNVRVTTTTTGTDLDPDGYTLSVDDGPGQAVPVNGTLTLSALRSGEHVIRLDGLASNCAASESNPRPVGVSFGATADVAFAVACVALTGSLRMTTATTGMDLDPDGYTVSVDGGVRQAVGVNGALIIADLRSGEHLVQLDGLAANCTVSESNPRSVGVSFGATAEVAFAIACVADAGSLRVIAVTTGADFDANGYSVDFRGDGQAVPVNGSVIYVGVPAGEYPVEFRDVAANCAVSGANPRPGTITFGVTTEVVFEVSCAAVTASIQIAITTTGADLDPDGYTVSVDGGVAQAAPVNGTITISGLLPGDHIVGLEGVAVNCTVDGDNPRAVSLGGGATAEVSFGVACIANAGNLRVTAVTTGGDVDPNGYSLDVRGSGQVVPVNGSVIYAGVPAGEYSIELSDVASNCVVSGANPRPVTITFGATTDAVFEVACAAVTGSIRISIATTGADLDPDGYSLSVDGGPTQATPVTAAFTISGLPPGDHTVALDGVAANCTVDGVNPRAVSLAGGATAEVAFAVACIANAGSLRVTAVTTGGDLDPNGYLVEVRGNGQGVPVNGSVTYVAVPAGEYSIELADVAPNCVVSGANPRPATVTFGATTEVVFDVACTAGTGTIRVTTATTGADVDPDGYTVLVQGLCHWYSDGDGGFGYECDYERTESVGVNGAVTISGVPVGAGVELQGVARNCTVAGENPRPATADVAFAVTCVATGSVRVTVATTGFDVDPNGYGVLVRGAPDDVSYAVAVNGTVTIQLLPGEQSVTLYDVAGNCRVGGQNPVTLTVVAAATFDLAFTVTCEALGSVQVEIATSGVALDPDGYRIRVDGAWYAAYAAPMNGAITISGLVAGDHTLALEGVAANCMVEGTNPRPVTVAAGGTTDIAFAVTCAAIGSIRVTAGTTGVDPDPDGYTLSVDGGPEQLVPVNGAITIPGLSVGEHAVALGSMASNCGVDGANPRSVGVTAGATAEVAFAVTCVASSTVRVTTTTTGADLDVDGYTVSVDAFAPPIGEDDGSGSGAATTSGSRFSAIGLNDTVFFSGLESGSHRVALFGVAPNCSVDGPNPRDISVAVGDTAAVDFAVTCTATGSVQVTTATTGADLDPDGYTVRVDGGSALDMPVTGTIVISGLLTGDHTVTLGGVAANCAVNGINPRTVSVTPGATNDIAFAVTCAAMGSVQVTAVTNGATGGVDWDLWARVDGGPAYSLGVNGAVTISGIVAGPHAVTLGGWRVTAGTCQVSGENPRGVLVTAGETVTATFLVTCHSGGVVVPGAEDS